MSRHDVRIAASPERVYHGALAATLAEMPISRLLFTLRGVAYRRDASLREFFSTPPFLVLEEVEPIEVVFGLAVRRRSRAATPAELRVLTHDGVVRAITNFRVEAGGHHATLSTETWVETFGRQARWLFRIYWLVVGPFSGLVRREFLRAAKRRAEA